MPKGKQYSELERQHLQELVSKYMHIIQNKQTDAVSIQKKKMAWEKIAVEYNANSQNAQKDVTQLKKLWENIKFRRKAELAAKKRTTMKTGGGPPPETVAGNNPDLGSCPIDIEIRDAIDSDTLVLAENQSGAYVVIDDFLVPESRPTEAGNDSQPTTAGRGVATKALTTDYEENSLSLEYINGDRRTQQSSTPEMSKGSKRNLFSEAAQLRIDKADYLLKLEKELGGMRKEEQSLKCELLKQQLELARQQLETARNDEHFLKMKRQMELKKLM